MPHCLFRRLKTGNRATGRTFFIHLMTLLLMIGLCSLAGESSAQTESRYKTNKIKVINPESYDREDGTGGFYADYKGHQLLIFFEVASLKVFYQNKEILNNIEGFLRNNIVKSNVVEAEGAWEGESFKARKIKIYSGFSSR
jgi:hypothetical protein